MEPVVAAFLLALVHIFAGKLRFLEGIPVQPLALARGWNLGCVRVRAAAPELAEAQERLGESAGGFLSRLEHYAYVLALAGLAFFYGVERVTVRSRDERREREGEDATGSGAFWLSIGSFAFYTGLIGYSLADEADMGLRTRPFCDRDGAPLRRQRLRIARAP